MWGWSSTDKAQYLNTIVLMQDIPIKLTAINNFQIYFYRHSISLKLQLPEKVAHTRAFGDFSILPINMDMHLVFTQSTLTGLSHQLGEARPKESS